jgi:hypothetical protein
VRRSCFHVVPVALALSTVGCDETSCEAFCPETGIVRTYTSNGDQLNADEVLVELHGDDILCRVALDAAEAPEP